MGPRKRSRPNPKVEAPVQAAQEVSNVQAANPDVGLDNFGSAGSDAALQDAALKSTKMVDTDSVSVKSKSSRAWYAGSTWPRIQKASPSIQVARETILADKSVNGALSADLSKFESRKRAISPTLSNNPLLSPDNETQKAETTIQKVENSLIEERRDIPVTEDATGPSELGASIGLSISDRNDDSQRPSASSGWLGWLRPSNRDQNGYNDSPKPAPQHDSVPGPSELLEATRETLSPLNPPGSKVEPNISIQSSNDEAIAPQIPTPSWFNMWPPSVSNRPSGGEVKDLPQAPAHSIVPVIEIPMKNDSTEPAAGSTWAFWSRDLGKSSAKENKTEDKGELAIKGEPSQDHPAPARAEAPDETKAAPGKQTKRGRPLSSDVQEPNQKILDRDLGKKKAASQITPNTPSESSQKPTPSQSPAPIKAPQTNLLLPSFRGTYRIMENPSVIQQIARLLMPGQQSPSKHVCLIKDPPQIKRALAIGIHGLFPAPLLRTVIGQPTGTSIRFANHAASAISRWAAAHGYDCEIEKVALEGEGKIAERVDNLWKLLLNWIDHVRRADFILVACHSQGVPVALMLVTKLIEFGVVTSAKIGVCAMAGVSLGPFADYKSRFFSGSAAELFEFAYSDSEVSKRYESSLHVALKYGVRITYVGSIDDQLVSLESAVFSPVSHPYIYRAVFVDGRIHAPDFIAHLVGFALKLRNLGVSDHGIIRELSVPLAGSLYTGEGHSRLYDETAIYDVAVSFALETSSVGDVPLQVTKYEVLTGSNPFQLPWSMRGLLEEDLVKTELDQETAELLRQFDEWKPTTKVLKDVKYRLEVVKSKL